MLGDFLSLIDTVVRLMAIGYIVDRAV